MKKGDLVIVKNPSRCFAWGDAFLLDMGCGLKGFNAGWLPKQDMPGTVVGMKKIKIAGHVFDLVGVRSGPHLFCMKADGIWVLYHQQKRTKERIALAVMALLSLFLLWAAVSNYRTAQEMKDFAARAIVQRADAEWEIATLKAQELEQNKPCYELSTEERQLVESIVGAEARDEPFDGQRAVAQCILTGCLYYDVRPAELFEIVGYAKPLEEPATVSVQSAVSAVFDDGQMVTDRPIIAFYNPELVESAWHESQTYVMTVGHHRFFELGA